MPIIIYTKNADRGYVLDSLLSINSRLFPEKEIIMRRCVFQVFFIIFFSLVFFTGCNNRVDIDLLEKVVRMDNPTYQGAVVSDATVAEIKQILDKYKLDIAKNTKWNEKIGELYQKIGQRYLEIEMFKQTIETMLSDVPSAEIAAGSDREKGVYFEALTVSYTDRGVYRKAFDSVIEAIKVFPANSSLYYNAGICAAYIGKSFIAENDGTNGNVWYDRAVTYYKRAIDLSPEDADALYGLSVVLYFELKRTDEAIGFLEKAVELEKFNTDSRFLLAQAYYSVGRYDEALALYDDIAKITKIEFKKEQAGRNKKKITDMMRNLKP
jgi:tetratricopeptide (TPR) repeat protein